MKRRTEKHMTYFSVLEAFQTAKDCALCELEAASLSRYFDSLLYENVNDSGVRADLARSRGYCHRHAHLLLSHQDSLGTAILYQDQVKLFLQFLQDPERTTAKMRRKNRIVTWSRSDQCPACRIEIQNRDRYLTTFLDGLSEEEMRQSIEASPGLCVAHLLLALNRLREEKISGYLREAHVRKFSALLEDLTEYIRKNDYRFSHEGFGKEGDSWTRVVKMMTGLKDVF